MYTYNHMISYTVIPVDNLGHPQYQLLAYKMPVISITQEPEYGLRETVLWPVFTLIRAAGGVYDFRNFEEV